MTYQPFYISSFENESGLDNYFEPFLIPEKAFPVLEDAFAWRGRIERRNGFSLLGRLRRVITGASLGNSSASPWTFTIYSTLASAITGEPDASLEIGSVTITVGAIVFTDNGDGTLSSVTPGNSGTINYATGSVTLTHTAGAGQATTIDFNYYPALPVMGLRKREQVDINQEKTIAFDTKYAYTYSGGWEELPSSTPTTWNGANYNLFWTANYWQDGSGNDLFWATNFNVGATPDPIRYYNNITWTTFDPVVSGTTRLQQALILLPFKDRLLAFNTYEGTTLGGTLTHFPQRVRWSQNGDPTDLTNGWLDTVIGRGGYLDAPTNEHIVGAEFIKDVLVVKFERSSWRLLYTGNETLPFQWQKINTELGGESTFSLVPFDRGVFAVGNFGITTDDAINVSRIDERIPSTVFRFQNKNEGPRRIYGIRDFSKELVYWAYPDFSSDPTFNNKILVFNYRSNTFATFNDSFTCFGYFQGADDFTWATLPYDSWASWNDTWSSGQQQSFFPDIAAGNQQGYVVIFQDQVQNDTSLSITAMSDPDLTVPNHNLTTGRIVKITGIVGSASTLNGTIAAVNVSDSNTFSLYNPLTNEPVALPSGYIGGGQITVFNNINIISKRFSLFYEQGDQARLGFIDFFFDKTSVGEVAINLYIDENTSISTNDDPNNVGTNKLDTHPNADIPFQANQEKIWNRLYSGVVCQNFQFQITMTDEQMLDEDINSSDVVLHAVTLYATPNARMIQ